MLHDYEMDNRYDEVKEWYDGYRFGKADVYCPWDVVNYCNDHIHNPEAEPENYWMNTSGNSVIHHFIDSINEPDMLTKTELEWLINGKTVIKQIDEMVTYNDLYSTMDHLWSTLFMTGYLTQRGRESDGRYCLAIPNREIRNIITERILTLFQQEVKKTENGRTVLPGTAWGKISRGGKPFEFVFAEDGQRTRYLCAEITERKFLSWNSAWNLKL